MALSLTTTTSAPGNNGGSNHRRPWLHGIPTPLPLQSKIRITKDTHLYTFSLSSSPDDDESTSSSSNESNSITNDNPRILDDVTLSKPAECRLTLGIPICSCLLVSPLDDRGLIRPYTPVSSRRDIGSFTLLVKRYPNGSMGAAFEKLNRGDKMLFWQIPKNIKEQYPFGNTKSIVMLAAGTGITPMYQALRRIFDPSETDNNDGTMNTKVTLIYGSRTKKDILLKNELKIMQRHHPHRFTIVHVLSRDDSREPPHPPCDDVRAAVRLGRIDKAAIVDICGDDISLSRAAGGEGRRSDGLVFWVCGPPSFYDDLCGSREDEGVGGVLGELGVAADCVVKF